MGSAASIVSFKRQEVMTVDAPGPGWRSVQTFSRAIFKKYEWETMKVFCQKYKIPQKDLVRVFRTYLAGDEAYIREFRVRATDVRQRFGKYSKLYQEVADVFIPAMYVRNFAGLQAVESSAEVSFARFIINSYIFGCQHFPDLIYDFFAVLRQKLDIQLSVVISPFSISKMVTILTEEFPETGTLHTLKQGMKRLEEGPDMRLFSIINMGVKYPLMFYVIERFRKLYKRLVFGDKFWANRKFIKIRHVDMDGYLDADLDSSFTSIEIATRRTALSIIADALAMTNEGGMKAWCPSDTFRLTPTLLSPSQVTHLKHWLGYKSARAVLLESNIALESTPSFIESHLVQAPVASPPTKNLPVSPWTEDGQQTDHFDDPADGNDDSRAPSAYVNTIDFPLTGYDANHHRRSDNNSNNNNNNMGEIENDNNPAAVHDFAGQEENGDYLQSHLFPQPAHHHHHPHHHSKSPSRHNSHTNLHHDTHPHPHPHPPSHAPSHSSLLPSQLEDDLVPQTTDLPHHHQHHHHHHHTNHNKNNSATPNVPESAGEGSEIAPNSLEREGILVIRDNQYEREFRYDVHTGRSRWQQLFVDADGDCLREAYY